MPLTLSTKRTARVGMAALACFIALGVVAWATPSDAPAAATDDAPNGLVITSPRICAALAVYELAAGDARALSPTRPSTPSAMQTGCPTVRQASLRR